MPTFPHVVVIGAGIGGLCLAQGLRGAGVQVEVYERDAFPGSRWEGYRIHINPAGARSLRACLPDRLWEAFLAISGRGGDFGFLTERLAELVVEESVAYPGRRTDPAEDHYAVDRATLRRLLLAGLDDVVHFGAEFRSYEHTADGQVTALFADGRTAVGDVLVGADGASSRVRRQYLPHARNLDAGVSGVAHKLPLTEATRAWIPARLQSGMNLISGAGPVSVFTSAYDPPAGARAALEQVAGPQTQVSYRPYLLCALNTDPATLPGNLTHLDHEALRRVVGELLHGWHATLRRMLAESDPASVSGIDFIASTETPPWPASRVTLLGDAIHTMPATGGLGGNTALRDARLLGHQLSRAADGEQPLVDAIGEYEHHMRDYGYAAIRDALATRDRMLAGGTLGTRSWFRLCQAIGPLRRRTFAGWSAHTRPRHWERPATAA